jgi:polar amino acid transport system substrate-binding protein
MFSLCNSAAGNRRAARKAEMLAFLLGTVLTHRAEAADVLSVCIDEANPTSAMDVRVARAAAKTQGDEVRPVTFEGYGKGGEGFPLGRFAKMAHSDCQLIMGFPVDVSDPNLPPNVKATSAYASTGFVLVRRGASKEISLGDLPKGSEVGIAQLDTFAGLLYSIHPNIVMHVYEKDSLMLADLAARHIAAVVAWQPSIEFYESRHPKLPPVSVRVLPDRHMQWNLVALYVPQSQSAANVFDKGLYELQSKGQLEPLIKPYHQAAAAGAEPNPAAGAQPTSAAGRTSARWPAAHLSDAIAREVNAGQLIKVADTGDAAKSGALKKKHAKVPALYTADQASKGQLAYYQNCAMCHGPNLDGQPGGYSGPALKGADFADPSYDFHVKDIFNFVAKLMPAATPGSLSHEQNVQIMAFLLQQNGYPPGSKELVYEEAEKSTVPLRYYGK